MVRLDNVSRSFGAVQAVNGLSFDTREGEIFALLGPNGAGKTTSIKMILGMLRPDSGSIHFQGKEIDPGNDNRYKARIGYVPENCALYESLTGSEYLNFIGQLHHLDPEQMRVKINRLMSLVSLGDATQKLIRDYSKGMKQRILIVSALLHDPDLLILDEPFSGLDASAVLMFKELLREEVKKGKTVIFCSHILEVVERLVDRILIIHNGRALVAGTPDEIIHKTGHASLDRAFNELTGGVDTDAQARELIDIIRKADSTGDRTDG